MPWSFRKSLKLGAFKINLSNSGFSGSFGGKGARISTGKRGTYLNLGTNGIYYRRRINRKNPLIPLLIFLGLILALIMMSLLFAQE